MSVVVRRMTADDIDGVVALQVAAFPPPFDPDLLWQPNHIETHLREFPEGQFVAVANATILGSASNTRISEENWQAHQDWETTVGGHEIRTFDPTGSTLYGLDISVHPGARGQGVGRRLYEARFALVRQLGMARYGTGCRMPDFQSSGYADPADYAEAVVKGERTDRTLTPLLRYRLRMLGVILNYMDDEESGHAAALLEHTP